MQDTITNTPQPTFSSGLGNFYFSIKYETIATLSSLQTSKVQSLLRRKIRILISEAMKKTSSVKPKNPCQSNPAGDYLNYSA